MRLVDFVKEVLAESRVRVIGVCYGHQIAGRALGAKVATSEGGAWEVSVCQVNLTGKGKELFGGKDTIVGLSSRRHRRGEMRLILESIEHPPNAQGPRILLSRGS